MDDNATDLLGPARIVLRGAFIPFINAEKILVDGSTQPGVSLTEEVHVKASKINLWIKVTTVVYPDMLVDAEIKKEEIRLLPLYHICWSTGRSAPAYFYGILLECVGTYDGRSCYHRLGMFKTTRRTIKSNRRYEDFIDMEAIIKLGTLFGTKDSDVDTLIKPIEVDVSDELSYENNELDYFFAVAYEEEAVYELPKELYEELLKEPPICLI